MVKFFNEFKRRPLMTLWKILVLPIVIFSLGMIFISVSLFNLSIGSGIEAVKDFI